MESMGLGVIQVRTVQQAIDLAEPESVIVLPANEFIGTIVINKRITISGDAKFPAALGGIGAPAIVIDAESVNLSNLFIADVNNYFGGIAVLINKRFVNSINFENVKIKGCIEYMVAEQLINIKDLDATVGGTFYIEVPISAPNTSFELNTTCSWLKLDFVQQSFTTGTQLLGFTIMPISRQQPGDFLIAEIQMKTKQGISSFWVSAHIGQGRQSVHDDLNHYIEYKNHKLYFYDAILLGEELIRHIETTNFGEKELIFSKTGDVVYGGCFSNTQVRKLINGSDVVWGTYFRILAPSPIQIGDTRFNYNTSSSPASMRTVPKKLQFNGAGMDNMECDFDVYFTGEDVPKCLSLVPWITINGPDKLVSGHCKYKVIVDKSRLPSNHFIEEISAVLLSNANETLSLTATIRAENEVSITAEGDLSSSNFLGNEEQIISPIVTLENELLPVTIVPPLKRTESISTHAYYLPSITIKDVEFLKIMAGEFIFGFTDTKIRIERDFYISKFPITNSQYFNFISNNTSASSSIPPSWKHAVDGKKTFTPGKKDHPVVQVTWFEANSYCKWLGGRLPTEEEWERCARYTDGRLLPWLKPDDSIKVHDWPINLKKRSNVLGVNTTNVIKFPEGASVEGVMDLIGNVWEWTSSSDTMKKYIAKGCGYNAPMDTMEINAIHRLSQNPETRLPILGFRCVIDV